MKRSKLIAIIGLGITMLLAGVAIASLKGAPKHDNPGLVGSVQAGKQKAAVCAACHGSMGNSINSEWPALAGQHASFFSEQLKAFRSNQRVNALMNSQAVNLSDQDIADLAAYYAVQPPKPGMANAELVELGERIYRAGDTTSKVTACAACHGPNGRGNPLINVPNLLGQKGNYIEAQLNAYAKGERNYGATANQMQAISANMTDEQKHAVASFIEGLTETDWASSAPASTTAPNLTESAPAGEH